MKAEQNPTGLFFISILVNVQLIRVNLRLWLLIIALTIKIQSVCSQVQRLKMVKQQKGSHKSTNIQYKLIYLKQLQKSTTK